MSAGYTRGYNWPRAFSPRRSCAGVACNVTLPLELRALTAQQRPKDDNRLASSSSTAHHPRVQRAIRERSHMVQRTDPSVQKGRGHIAAKYVGIFTNSSVILAHSEMARR